MSEVVAKRSVAGQVDERVKADRCLVCEGIARRRGLCDRHYALFLRTQREKGDRQKQVEFEEACIREGKVLAVNQVRRIKGRNPFDV